MSHFNDGFDFSTFNCRYFENKCSLLRSKNLQKETFWGNFQTLYYKNSYIRAEPLEGISNFTFAYF